MPKKIYDMSIEQLKKRSSNHKSMYYAYVIFAIVISMICGTLAVQSLDGLNANQKTLTGTNYLLLLDTILISVMVFLMIFLWFIIESSYYKMLECFEDMMVYLKERES